MLEPFCASVFGDYFYREIELFDVSNELLSCGAEIALKFNEAWEPSFCESIKFC